MINEDTISESILKAIEIICSIYSKRLIEDAYIIGSVAKGTATEESDIDIILINQEFVEYVSPIEPMRIRPELNSTEIRIINTLRNIGATFKEPTEEELFSGEVAFGHWIYKGKEIHLMITAKMDILDSIRITIDMCADK